MMTDSFASAILSASLTGAGIVLAFYSLILPHSGKVFDERAETLIDTINETKQLAEGLSTATTVDTLQKIKENVDSISNIEDVPWYMKWGILITFTGFAGCAIFSVWWFDKLYVNFVEQYLSTIFIVTIFLFAITGIITLRDILTILKVEYQNRKMIASTSRKTG